MVSLTRDQIQGTVIHVIMTVAPFLCLKIDVGDIREDAADNEVFLYITDKPFNFPLGERMPRLTQFCFEASVFMNCS